MAHNCPNCGAASDGPFCGFCGTPLYTQADFMAGASGKVVHMFYEEDGALLFMDVSVNQVEWRMSSSSLLAENNTEVIINACLKDPDINAWREAVLKHTGIRR